MKKGLPFGLVLFGLAMTGAAAPLRIVTTTTDLASLATLVGGSRVTVSSICKGYQDPHFVESKPSYLLELRRADLLIAIGLELEVGWLPPLLQQARNPKILSSGGYLDASSSANILERPTEQVTRAMGDVHPFGNPHYWLDPENGRAIARAIAQKLSNIDPPGKASYDENLARFEANLTTKEKEWAGRMDPFAGTEVITYHNSWPNFLKYFKLKAVGYIEPKPGIPPSPSHTLEVINLGLARKVPVILVEPYFDTKTPAFIASKTGGKLLIFYPSVGGTPEIADYFSVFDHDIELFVKGMGARK